MTEWRKAGESPRPMMARAAAEVQPLAQVIGDIPDVHVIAVRERRVTVDYPTIIQHNINTDTIELDLDGEWDGMSVVLVLGPCGGATELSWHGEPLTLPSALAEDTGGIDVSVVGYSADGDTRLVTVAAPSLLNVIKSGCTVGEAPGDETPDLIGQLVAAGDAANKAAQAANTAAGAANGAASAANTAASAANTAAGKANTAATKATDAATEATDAAGDATRAAQSANAAAEAAGAAAEAARGNVLRGTLGPAPVLSADDAYATKPRRLTVYGNTRQNLWVNPSGTVNGVTVTSNKDGSLTLSGTASSQSIVHKTSYVLVPGKSYCLSIDSNITDDTPSGSSYTEVDVVFYSSSDTWLTSARIGYGSVLSATFSVPANTAYSRFRITVKSGDTLSGTYRVMLNEGSTAQPWCPPGLNGVDELSIVVSTTDSADDGSTTPVDLDGHVLNSLPDGTRDELRIDGTGAVTLVQRVGVATAPMAAGLWLWGTAGSGIASFTLPARSTGTQTDMTGLMRCDKLPVRQKSGEASYVIVGSTQGHAKNPAITNKATAASVAGGATYLYKLAAPQEVDLPGVTLPTLPSPNITVYHDSDVPSDITVEYERDVTIAFDKLQAQVSATTVREATNG